jgi:hypothetical protein
MRARLKAGDRMNVIIALTDLQRLLQREAAPREWSVDVTGFPLPCRLAVAQILQLSTGLNQEAVEKALDKLPFQLEQQLTRGQAEDLAFLLGRQKVSYQLRKIK